MTTPINYEDKIPNNVDLSSDRRLQRALEGWQPKFMNWWGEMGPTLETQGVYLRTATSVGREGWAHFDHVNVPDYRWGIFLAERDPGRTIAFGEHQGEPAWQQVPGEYRADLQRLIVIQGDTEPASVEQQKLLGLTAPSLYDLRNLFQVNVEEGRHLWAMVYLLHAYFGKEGREEAESLLLRNSGSPDSPRILGAFNEETADWLAFFMFTYFTDRDGKYQLGTLKESAFDPLSRTCEFMLKEEAHHMFVGTTGVDRVVERSAALVREHDTLDIAPRGGIPLDIIQKYINFHYTVSLDLFGSETSTNAANYFTAGLKGRWQETRRKDDHQLTEDGVFLDKPTADGTWRKDELSALLALNLDLRGEYIADCETGIKRWNRIMESAEIGFRFALPHPGFNRSVGVSAGFHVTPDGSIVDEQTWAGARHKWLPTTEDLAFVRSLMHPVYERGKIASWVAPPRNGINGKPFDYEYVYLPEESAMTLFNATEYLLDRHLRDGHGGRPAVVCGPVTLTYEQLADETRRVAAGFRAIGVRPEERIMLCMADGVELLSGILGAMYLGAVPVPVSTMVTGAELATVLADSRARVLCVSVEFADAARAALATGSEVEHVVLDGPADLDGMQWSSLRTAGSLDAPYSTWPDSPALWLYTSGTTGKPKGAMHRHGSVRDVCELYGNGVLGVTADDRCLSVPKLFFAYGLGNSAFFPLAAGATTILERGRPTPALMAGLAASAQPTLFFGVPTFYSALLHSDVPDDSFASVRQGVSAGEPLPPVLFRRFRERFGVEILDGLGSTEALHIFLSNRPGQVHPGSSGTPVGGYRVEIRDEHGAPIEASGLPGDLFLSGPSVATGYWCRTETTRALFQGEWLRTGDTYVRNEDGTFTCLGRSNDMLKAGGIWVSPTEVEERLLEHPDVAEVAVVAGRDEDGLDKPIACVVPVPGRTLDPSALVQWCREGLAAYKRPRAVVRMTELPKTATGKIRRNVLRELVADELVVRPVAAVEPPAVLT